MSEEGRQDGECFREHYSVVWCGGGRCVGNSFAPLIANEVLEQRGATSS